MDIPHPDTVTYCNEFLLDESILLAVPRSFLSRITPPPKEPIDLHTVSGLPFILLPVEQLLGSIGQKICEQAGFLPDLRLQCSSVNRALSLASEQLGVTFAPQRLPERPFESHAGSVPAAASGAVWPFLRDVKGAAAHRFSRKCSSYFQN